MVNNYIVQQRGSEAVGYELRHLNPKERRTLQFLNTDLFAEFLPEQNAIEKYKILNEKRDRNYEDSFYATD